MKTRNLTLGSLVAVALLVAAGMQFATAIPDRTSGEGARGVLARIADRLELDDATRAEIRTLIEASFEDSEELRADRREVREVLRSYLSEPEPDYRAVLLYADEISDIEKELRRTRVTALLDIRERLTPKQREELVQMRNEFFDDGAAALETQCAPEIESLCPDRRMGSGLIVCLARQREQLSETCRSGLQSLRSDR